jgi:hypothetical protein
LPLQEINVAVLSGPRTPNNIADAGASEDGDHLSTHEDCEVHTSGKTSPDILLKIFCGHQNSDIFGKFCQL